MTNFDGIIERLEALTSAEKGLLVKQLEDRWGVESPQTVQERVKHEWEEKHGSITGPKEVEQEEFSVILTGHEDGMRIKVIKEVRQITGLGLKESRDFIETVPATVGEYLGKEEAELLKKRLEDVGGFAEIR